MIQYKTGYCNMKGIGINAWIKGREREKERENIKKVMNKRSYLREIYNNIYNKNKISKNWEHM